MALVRKAAERLASPKPAQVRSAFVEIGAGEVRPLGLALACLLYRASCREPKG